MAEKLYLVDGSGYIYRAYYAIRPLSTRDGVPTNAVLGFARMLGKLIKEEKPHLLGVAFDPRDKNFRHEIYSEYKANRDSPPEDLPPQFPLIHELVRAMDIPVLMAPRYEADDVIATIAQKAVAAGHEVVLVTGDKDLMQLVGPSIAMFDPMKDKHYAREDVIERFGVPPERVVDVLALAGDTSDNIPGVPKVGPKSASKLVADYGDVEDILRALGEPGRKLKAFEQSVLENAADARLSKRLATLAHDAPVPLELDKLRYAAPDPEKLGPFLRRIEAIGLLREFGFDKPATPPQPMAVLPSPPEQPVLPLPSPRPAVEPTPAATLPKTELAAPTDPDLAPIDRDSYRVVLDMAALDRLIERARTEKRLSIDLQTTSLDPNRADIVGVALCVPGEPAAYVPVGHRYLGVPKQLPLADVLKSLRSVLEDEAVAKVGQNIKYDVVTFKRAGVTLRGVGDDATIAAFLLDPARASYSLDAMARELLGHEKIRYADVAGSGKTQVPFEQVPMEAAGRYAAEDADVALRLCNILSRKMREANLTPLYREIELPLVPVLATMERTGISVDIPRIKALGDEFTTRLDALEAEAHRQVGEKVNLASPKQLAELFFDKLGYEAVKKTKTGYSTDSEVLEALAEKHELPRVILEHRMLSKLKSTYVDMLQRMVNKETGRVHTSYNQCGAATGRMSSNDPNLQNIPVRSDDGRRIRAAFVADPGWSLISADYSQVELRVMAHLSADPHFIDAFKRGEDIQYRTAKEILTGGQEPDAEMRRRAKAINFGILYGLSEFGLSRQLGIPRAEASTYIKAYFARYPKIRSFLDTTIEEGRRTGYVTTMSGRRRYLPDLNSKNRNARQGAERIAMNTPIQGSAADLIKMAMLRVQARLEREARRGRMLLQVHDELVLEAPHDEVSAVSELVREEMSRVMTLEVPLVVDVGSGQDWASAH